MGLVAREITPGLRDAFRARIAALEEGVTYPLGGDRFSLDHGDDYFAFFDRLGAVTYYAALDGERVVGVGCGILRDLLGGPAWYLCDLKVHPAYRGRWVPTTLLLHAVPRYYPRCGRGYGITMDPSDGENPVVRLFSRVPLIQAPVAARLVFYSLGAAAMADVAPLVARHRGPLSYRSLRGIKDIVLQSTGAPMPLWHVQHGPMAEAGEPRPAPDGVHMFCTPEGSALHLDVQGTGLEPDATATVLAHRMGDRTYDFVLTSDI